MARCCALLVALPLGLLAACRTVGSQIAVPADLSPPPEALLEPPSMGATPAEPRFVGALVAYAAAVRELPSHVGADADLHQREALRLLAGAVALLPARPELRQPAYRVATELRVTAARMATELVMEPRAQIAQAKGALAGLATFLLGVVARDRPPDVRARVQAFAAAVHDVDADRTDPDRARLHAALLAALDALEATLSSTAPR